MKWYKYLLILGMLGLVIVGVKFGTNCALGMDANDRAWYDARGGFEYVMNHLDSEGHFIGDTNSTATTSTPSSTTPATTSKPKHTHEYTSEVTTEPTCVSEGTTTYTCECGNTYTEPIEATGEHKYKEEVTKEATCTEEGTVTYTCEVCGDTYTEPIEATGHTYSSEVTTEPTCTGEGVETYTCDCGDAYTEPIKAKGHTEGEWTITKEAGIFTNGSKEIRCTDCSAVLNTSYISSKYPVWYLYTGLGILSFLIVLLTGIFLYKRKKK